MDADVPAARVPMRVLDSVHDEGPKLVEIDPGATSGLRALQPGLQVVSGS